MALMDEQVGALYVKTDPARPLTDDDRGLLSAVAQQVAQQVENIRLLADASRARAEAEEATRRLTRKAGNLTLSNRMKSSLGFKYDSNQVTPWRDPLPKELILSYSP